MTTVLMIEGENMLLRARVAELEAETQRLQKIVGRAKRTIKRYKDVPTSDLVKGFFDVADILEEDK